MILWGLPHITGWGLLFLEKHVSTTIVAGQPISWAPGLKNMSGSWGLPVVAEGPLPQWECQIHRASADLCWSLIHLRSLFSTWWRRLSTVVASQTTWTESSSTPMRPNGSAPCQPCQGKKGLDKGSAQLPLGGYRNGAILSPSWRCWGSSKDGWFWCRWEKTYNPMARLSTGYSVWRSYLFGSFFCKGDDIWKPSFTFNNYQSPSQLLKLAWFCRCLSCLVSFGDIQMHVNSMTPKIYLLSISALLRLLNSPV